MTWHVRSQTLALAVAALTAVAGLGALAFFALTDDVTSEGDILHRLLPPQGFTPASPISAELDSSARIAGQYAAPHPGQDGRSGSGDERSHLAQGVSFPICTPAQITRADIAACYHSNPPTSGPHAAAPAPWGVLNTAATKESLVHNMEHGGVVIWYNTDEAGVVDQLSSIVTSARSQGQLVVLSPYPGLDPGTIALTSWTRLDKFPVRDLTRTRVERFISDNQRRFNPEGF